MQTPRLPRHVEIFDKQIFQLPQIFDCIDGLDGRFGIARKRSDGRFEHYEISGGWTPAFNGEPEITGHIFTKFTDALSQLRKLYAELCPRDFGLL